MCNIAGYIGEKQAAPILLEMLRRQQPYDGDMSTGIATIHEGKLHYRKIVGDVDKFIRETDVLDLPGTIGIAHTRPGGNPEEMPRHPFISAAEDMAMVLNGTRPKKKHWDIRNAAADYLDGLNYPFRMLSPSGFPPQLSRTGEFSPTGEVCCFMMEDYLKKGLSISEAQARAAEHIFTDAITVVINENFPDTIFALRVTRPMEVIFENGEVYMATCRYAFPDELKNDPLSLPLTHACQVTRNGFSVTPYRVETEEVAEMSPFTYKEGYKRVEALLKGGEKLFFDDLESAINKMRDLWEGEHTYVQHARLLYELLWQFDMEGRLKREMRLQERSTGERHRWYFWIED